MDLNALLILDPDAFWINNQKILVVPGWVEDDYVVDDNGSFKYPLDMLQEKKVECVISFFQLSDARVAREFGNRSKDITIRYFVDVWGYNRLLAEYYSNLLDDYYTRSIFIHDYLQIVKFNGDGYLNDQKFPAKRYILEVKYKKEIS